jgi:hypothetical protein
MKKLKIYKTVQKTKNYKQIIIKILVKIKIYRMILKVDKWVSLSSNKEMKSIFKS